MNNIFDHVSLRTGRLLILIFATILMYFTESRGQEPARPSLAGEQAAATEKVSLESYPYNVKISGVLLKFDADFTTEYNNNINLADSKNEEAPPEQDVILRPHLNTHVIWPMTKLNTLKLDLGLGIEKHLQHPEADVTSLIVSPGSELTFDVFVGDFRINFHDRLTLEQNPISESTLSNTSKYGRLTNTIGVSVLWDLNEVVLGAGYDHVDIISTTKEMDVGDRASDQLFAYARYTINPTTSGGVQASVAKTTFKENERSNMTTLTAGPFIDFLLTRYTNISASAGYRVDFFAPQDEADDLTFLQTDTDEDLKAELGERARVDSEDSANGYYASLKIVNRLSRHYTHTLSLGNDTQPGLASQLTKTSYIRYSSSWAFNREISLQTELFYEKVEDSGTRLPEKLNRVGGNFSANYLLTKHLSTSLRYGFTRKDSDLPLRDYSQNVVALALSYDF